MKKALVVHPDLKVIGGAEKVALYVLNYLLEDHWSVTLLTLDPVDLEEIAKKTEFDFINRNISVSVAYCPAFIRKSSSLSLWKIAFLHRAARKLADEFDLCISTYNELDFGKKGIQYIHHPYWPERRVLHKHKTISNHNVLDKNPCYEKIYRFIAHSIAGNFRGFQVNTTLVNSQFMQGVVKSVYGIDSTVLYPGFLSDGDIKSPENEMRPFQLVTISRLTSDKNIVELLNTFAKLYEEKPDAKLIIAGYPVHSAYFELIKNLIARHNLPVEIKTDISQEEVRSLLSQSQFYISTKKYEHFGISVLEAAAMGCIPLVHRSGGVIEIVPFSQLQFDQFDELPPLIAKLQNDPAQLHEIRVQLYHHVKQFHKDHFYARLREVIDLFIRGNSAK